jgi:putative membrane protein
MSRLTNDVTELAKERNRQAAERSLTSWINISLLLIGFGFVIEEIPAGWHPSPSQTPPIHLHLNPILGLGTIALGIVILIPVVIAHRQSIRVLEQAAYLTQPTQAHFASIIAAVILFALVALVNVLLAISQQ